ncbi:MAG TPA: ATPase [Erythrobacter sp.]|nr:ATPase [Erythrobacter sp.]
MNRELSLAREFLGSQSRELDSLGRIASERLSTHADELQDLIKRNGKQIDAIASVSSTAMTNMEKLRDDLPVIANSARDVSNQVGNAGRTAHEQLDKLIAGFDRLNHFGRASEKQVEALTGKIGGSIETFEGQIARLDELAEERFAGLKQKSEEFRADLDGREVEALAAMRHRADELRKGVQSLRETLAQEEDECLAALNTRIASLRGEGETLAATLRQSEADAFANMRKSKERLYEEIAEVVSKLDAIDAQAVSSAQKRIKALFEEVNRFDNLLEVRDRRLNEEIAKRQDKFDARESEANETLSSRMAELDKLLTERSEAQIERTETLVRHGKEIADKVTELNELFASVASQAEASRDQLSQGLGEFSQNISENREQLSQTEAAMAALTDSSVRLLEIIQSGANQSREELPRSIQNAVESISSVEKRATALSTKIEEASKRSEALSSYVVETQETLETAGGSMESIFSSLSSQTSKSQKAVNELRDLLAQLEERSERLSETTREKLTEAINQLDEATRNAFSNLQDGTDEQLIEAAEKVGSKAAEAVDRALLANSAKAIENLEQSAANAANVGTKSAIQLRDQLGKVNQLIVNLEQRVERAREMAQEQADNDFARRMALITEALNSNAIDVTRILASEVSDTAWTAYLKGDRGMFTRRAVRLLENTEARDIATQYQEDDEFREHVNRYVHDFEAMLRSLLSTRDGNVLGVTVLSSDVGKLYVALAQAIERLRN